MEAPAISCPFTLRGGTANMHRKVVVVMAMCAHVHVCVQFLRSLAREHQPTREKQLAIKHHLEEATLF